MLKHTTHYPHRRPKMEWYFDEVAETIELNCPVTKELARVTLIGKGGGSFEDVIACSHFKEGIPTCGKRCLEGIESR